VYLCCDLTWDGFLSGEEYLDPEDNDERGRTLTLANVDYLVEDGHPSSE
jgi:hypothetical protein